jgi:hypothetical protein
MGNHKTAAELATRAADELANAMVALQHVGALFAAIEKAFLDGTDKDAVLLLAQIGIEAAGRHVERAESGSDFFAEVTQ